MLNYFKIFIIIFCLFMLSNGVFAETWENASMENNKNVYIDVDSVNSHNNSTYYNVIHFETGAFKEISTIQSKGNKAGIVSTCKYTDYLKNKSCANPLTNASLNVLEDISVKSFLYNANEIAKLTMFKKIHNINTIYKVKEDQEYLSKIFRMYRKRILQVWRQTLKNKPSNKVVVLISFDKKGKLISNILVKSGGEEANEAAITAVRQVGNLGKLTKDLNNKYIDIEFSFDYKNFQQ